MAPRKISDSDKQDILILYRQPEETTSTLAERYGVSNTTISRILKQSLSEQEYESLIQQKRSGINRFQADPKFTLEETPLEQAADLPLLALEETLNSAPLPPLREAPFEPVLTASASERRRRRRSTVASELTAETQPMESEIQPLEISPAQEHQSLELSGGYEAEPSALQEILEEEIVDSEEDFDELEDEDDELDELDDDDREEDYDLDDDPILTAGDLADFTAVHIQNGEMLQVLPLSEASIPKTFYLVVDRASELITRPLRDFAELGQIPEDETQEKTLPIFDNHRVAKRFLRRMQRVVKVPDGRMLQKVGPYLQAKGITRLLIDGRVYSL